MLGFFPTSSLLAIGLGACMAYGNGSNDVSKGIATLVGSGTTSYRRALAWGTFCTGLGALAGTRLAGSMVQTFGNGLFVSGTTPTFAAAIAIISGASVWVLLATRTGLPVSTTHAIVGSLAGVAVVAYGPHAVSWGTLVQKIALPLVASPLVALATVSALIRASRRALADCACVAIEPAPEAAAIARGEGRPVLTSALPQLRLTVATSAECAAASVPQALSLRLEYLHLRVTPMDHREGFLANATTAALVGAGAVFGLPMSTTHVASAAIIGIGVNGAAGQTNGRTVRDMILAWLVTVPLSALLGIGAFEVARVWVP